MEIYSCTHYNYSEHLNTGTGSVLNPAVGTALHCTDSLTRTNSEDQLT
jgi:hypothetical protein